MMMIPKDLELDKLELDTEPLSSSSSPSSFGFALQLPDLNLALRNFTRTREAREFLSGALAGAMTKAVLASLETIRTRMVAGVGSKNISGSFIEVIEQQGWQGLWAGNAINMLRIITTQAIELGTFECVKRTMTSVQEKWDEKDWPKLQVGPISVKFSLSWISPVAVAVAGAAAGVVSILVCHPLEVLKDRLTVSPDIYPTLNTAVNKIYRDGGVGAFYSGFIASTISFPLEVARKRLMVGALKGKCPRHMAGSFRSHQRRKDCLGCTEGAGQVV